MSNAGNPYRFAARCIGPSAGRAVGRHAHGTVAAVFERSFYFEVGDAFVCVCASSLGNGPLNVLAETPTGMNWKASGVRRGDRVLVHNGAIMVGGNFLFDTGSARAWSPSRLGEFSSASAVAGSLQAWTACARRWIPAEGFAPLFVGREEIGSPSPVLSAAAPALKELDAWLRGVMRGTVQSPNVVAVRSLLGLGPGLTPSGDDYLGGMMIAFRVLEYEDALSRLGSIIEREALQRTNKISRAHLAAARQGYGAAAIHSIINHLVLGHPRPLPSLLRSVDRIGHTSGWDALAGAVAALRVWTDAATRRHRAA